MMKQIHAALFIILQMALIYHFQWLCANRLPLNVIKTEIIMFRPFRKTLHSLHFFTYYENYRSNQFTLVCFILTLLMGFLCGAGKNFINRYYCTTDCLVHTDYTDSKTVKYYDQ